MLSIGAFSKISRVSANALRYYDEIGLLKPSSVNSENGYRYYSTEQLNTILLINKLKSYGLSLDEISEVLKNPDDDILLSSFLRQKRDEAQHKLYWLNYSMSQMNQDILNLERGINIMSYLDKIEVSLVEKKPQNILFIRKNMSTADTVRYLGELAQRIENDGLTALGPPITVFHHSAEGFNPDCYDNEVAIPVKEDVDGTRVLPGGLCATVTLNGPYTQLQSVYTKLQQWIEQNNYESASNPYEVYMTDPSEVAPEENITEVYFPVRSKS